MEESELKTSRRLDALSKITTYMREHYKEDLRLSGLASMFGYSDAYLSRMFRKYAKVNFKPYLQDIRMAYAYKELLNTDHTISSIALDNGICKAVWDPARKGGTSDPLKCQKSAMNETRKTAKSIPRYGMLFSVQNETVTL